MNLVTDADGRARLGVTLGERTGSATVLAVAGVVEKQVAFNVSAAAAAQIVVACVGGEESCSRAATVVKPGGDRGPVETPGRRVGDSASMRNLYLGLDLHR